MKIYQQEINDGLGEVIKTNASIAYCSEASIVHLQPEADVSPKVEAQLEKLLAKSNPDQIDLYYLESVLVSTGWNKNDDVFQSEPTWAARNTPEDKQFNFMHDENDIIGHITGSYILDKQGNRVEADSQKEPQDFDIVSQAVIYNSWTDPENRDRMSQIIAQIEEGKWFVSMECLFAGFDYALLDPEGAGKVLARDEDSAFLTKHLRCYGGTGEYEGYKVGRALRNISFSGKGLVSKPANPRSVILNSSKAFYVNDSTNKFSIGDIRMSDNLLEKQVAGLREELATAKQENEAIKAKIEEAKDKEFASTVEAFEADVQSKDEAIATLEETVKSTQAKIAELEDALATSQEELSVAMKDVEEMKKKEKMEKRKAALVEAGVSEEDVDESLATFESLEDEAFEAIIAFMDKKEKKEKKDKKDDEAEGLGKGKKPTMGTEAEESQEAEEEAEAEVSEELFDEVETTEATLVEAEESDELETTRASIASWLSENVFTK
jgi:hypothetical protein